MSDEATLGYAEAVRELDAILAELEADDVDVDLLAARVERAAELLDLCRSRITDARLKVDRVVAGLAPPAGDPDA